MIYVIRGGARDWFVARAGLRHSYTPNLQDARTFATRFAAEASRCGNEYVLSLEDAMQS